MIKLISFLIISLTIQSTLAREAISGSRYEVLTGQKKKKSGSYNSWDKKYAQHDYIYGKAPANFLYRSYKHIPAGSKVLDVGIGEGRNAVFLARKGYRVTGVDISSVAIEKSLKLAHQAGVRIKTIHKPIENLRIKNGSLDAIICFYYVDREITKTLKKWLKPGGVMIFEGYTLDHKKKFGSDDIDSYFLDSAELLSMFSDFKVLMYEEPVHNEELTQSIIVQKPL